MLRLHRPSEQPAHWCHLLLGPRRRCDAAHRGSKSRYPRGVRGYLELERGLDLGDQAPDRRMDRSVVPVVTLVAVSTALVAVSIVTFVSIVKFVLIAPAVVATAALVHHHLPNSCTIEGAIEVPAVDIVQVHGT